MFTCNVGDDLVLLSAPLPVINLYIEEANQVVIASWDPDPGSVQQMYKIAYCPSDSLALCDPHSLMTNTTWISIENLFPGQTYDFSVQAISNSIYSDAVFRSIVIGDHGFTVDVIVVSVCGSSIALQFLDDTLYISKKHPVTYQSMSRLVVIGSEFGFLSGWGGHLHVLVTDWIVVVVVVEPTPPTCCQQSPVPESCGSQQSLPPGGKERLHFVEIRPKVQARKGGW